MTVAYTGIEHLEVSGTFGAFVPGERFRNYTDEVHTEGFKAAAFGGQLFARIRF